MRKIYFLIVLIYSFTFSTFAQVSHTVNAGSYYYTPSNFTINVGDTVTWLNDGGLHNVNFDISVITGNSFGNPESFASSPTTGPVLYTHVFTIPGSYSYDCSVGSHAQNGMVGSLIVHSLPLNTYVPDDNFENYLEANGMGDGIPLNDSVLTSNVNSVISLDVQNLSISDLTGIEDFSSLETLLCGNNQLTNLDVSQNIALKVLRCQINQLTSLDVSQNILLTELRCNDNFLAVLDVSSNTQLENLYCFKNQLANLDVSMHPNLLGLFCQLNQLTALDISQNNLLTHLQCNNNSILTLDVSFNDSLKYLLCYNNQLTTLDVSNNASLLELRCQYNAISALDVTQNILLKRLYCNDNFLTNLDVGLNTQLEYLFCFQNQLLSLDVNNNIALLELRCQNNTISSLDVSQNILLELLFCTYNQITNLDVSTNSALKFLFCGDNQLTNLNVSQNPSLLELRCQNNSISTLDVSQNTLLDYLNFCYNFISSIDLTSNTLLRFLVCTDNQLSSLDLVQNVSLLELWCERNQLTFLDIKNSFNSFITRFGATNNPNLYCINVDDSTYSTNNWTALDSQSYFSETCNINQNTSSSVSIDSVVIDNDINCNGDFGDITIYVDNDTNSLGCNSNPTSPNPCGPNLYYQMQAFVDDGTAIFSSFGVNTTNASQVSVNTLPEGTYYILVVDSVAFNQAFPILYFNPNFGTQWSTVLSHPSVLDYDSVTISQEPAPFQTTENIISPTCYGSSDGSIIITSVTGNTAPYTYLWNDPLATTGTILFNLNSGEYICTITDAIGCSEDITFLVDTVFAVVANATITSNISCYGSSDGEIIASATGGNPPYNYNWTSGQTTQTISNLSTGVYTVFVTDNNGCNDFVVINIQDPNPFIVVANIVDASSLNNDGSIDITVSGATSPYSYFWIGPNGFSSSSEDITNLSSGSYSCVIIDANGCIENWTGVVSSNFISGCTDSTANNFNPFASVDDGSCLYSPFVYGCTDINALNYNSFATIDDSSCCYSSGQQWSQISQDIDAESAIDYSGFAVSLNSNGTSVAVGAPYNDGNGSNSGHVRLFTKISDPVLGTYTWTQIGQDIDGETANDYSGRSVSLSSDGNTVAIGSRVNDGNGSNSGHVRLFTKISDPLLGTYTWTQIGQDIDGEAAGDKSGFSVSLSNNGNIVAIGAINNDGNGSDAGHIRIYKNIGGFWTQIGQDIDGEAAYDFCGHSVSLSSNGNIVAIGAQGNDGNGTDAGHVRIFEMPTACSELGCLDPLALNFDPHATIDDSTCIYPIYGCVDTFAINYNILANVDDGSCTYYPNLSMNNVADSLCLGDSVLISWTGGSPNDSIEILVINVTQGYVYFGITQTQNTGSYIWLVSNLPAGPGDDYQFYIQDYPTVTSWDYGSIFTICPLYGCTDSTALNFDQSATVDDGTCIIDIYGCTDSTALNYNSLATVDDGSCFYGNCQSPAPINNHVTDITDTRATLNWNNMNSSNCMVLKYVIRYRELGANFWTTKSGGSGNGSCIFGLNNTSKVLMNLSPSTTYQYKIKAYYCFGGVSVWSLPLSFTTEGGCPPMTNLSTQTYPNNTNKVTFSWDSTGAYVFARVALRVDTIGSSWQTAGGFGVYYPTLSVNKFGLQQGQSYRAQGRTFCDSNITAFRSWWTPPMFWTQPGTIKLNGGDVIKNLEVYPNPSRDIFNISFNLDEIETIKIKIYNIIGEIVFEEDRLQFVGEYIKKIDMSKYNRGVYFLKIETENSIINKKLVLQ